VLQTVLPVLSQVQPWSEDAIRQALLDLAAELNMKTGTVMWPVRIALTGLLVTPGGSIEIAAALGLAETMRRIEAAIACLS
jgi:glutamyl-tRNA synthetase